MADTGGGSGVDPDLLARVAQLEAERDHLRMALGIACVLAVHDPAGLIRHKRPDRWPGAPMDEYAPEAVRIAEHLGEIGDLEQMAAYLAGILNDWLGPARPWDAAACSEMAEDIARVLPPEHPIAVAYHG